MIRQLLDKSWLPPAGDEPAGEAVDWLPAPDPLAAAKTALKFFIAVVTVLFSLLIVTLLSRSRYPDFEPLAGAPWQPFADPSRLYFNTALLVIACVALQLGVYGARQSRPNATVTGICASVLFSVAFLLAQLDLWRELMAMGFYVDGNPANSYFYLLTALHCLHLFGGLIALAYVVVARVTEADSVACLSGPLQLCARYWHFMLVIWAVLFGVLISSADTLGALAALCGF